MSTEVPPSEFVERGHAIAAAFISQLELNIGDPGKIIGLMDDASAELRTLWQHMAAANGFSWEPGTELCAMEDLTDRLLTDHHQRRQLADKHGGVVGVRSGLGHLDETLNGLQRGQLYMLAAMPGSGKTTLALQWAATVAQAGYPALYISLENDAADLARKTACRLGNVSYSAALKGKVDPATWRDAVGKLKNLQGRLYVATPRTIIPELGELIKDVQKRAGQPPALVVIDYLQALVKRSARGADTSDVRERIDRLTPELRRLGEVYGCAVVAISSQNRSGYAAGGMSAMKESGDIEYNADVTMTLARPSEKDAKAGQAIPPGLTPLILTVEKNRQGLTGQPIRLAMHGDRCTITEMEA